MIQQTLLERDTAAAVSQFPQNQPSEQREKQAAGDIKAILIDAAVQVGALIDAVCCHLREWVECPRKHPHPRMPDGDGGDQDTIVRLALAEDERSLRSGGYIEVRVRPEGKVIEAHGGYYDTCCQPRPVVDVALRCHQLDHQKLGQLLLMIHGRIMREYMVHELSEGSLELPFPRSTGPLARTV